MRIKSSHKNEPCKFARALLRAVFMPEELENKSLFGGKSNVCKTAETKDSVDPLRRDAVISKFT